jgi:predicted dehydrogenase
MVRQGDIGDIRLIEADFCINPPADPENRWHDPRQGGGSLLDIGIYPVFCALEFGSTVTGCTSTAVLRNNIDTTCSIQLTHANGELSVLFSSVLTNGRTEAIIHGSKGYLRLNRWWHTPTSLDLVPDGKDPVRFNYDCAGHGYQYEAAEVMRCLDHGRTESPLWSHEHSRRLISMLDTIRKQAGIRYPDDIESV